MAYLIAKESERGNSKLNLETEQKTGEKTQLQSELEYYLSRNNIIKGLKLKN